MGIFLPSFSEKLKPIARVDICNQKIEALLAQALGRMIFLSLERILYIGKLSESAAADFERLGVIIDDEDASLCHITMVLHRVSGGGRGTEVGRRRGGRRYAPHFSSQ